MSLLLEDKVALITGGASGIGLETARMFLREGAKVIVADINRAQGEQVVRELTTSDNAIFVQNDVADEASCRNAVAQAIGSYGRLDIAVNNAGIIGETKVLHEISAQGWQRTLDINVSGVFFGLKAQVQAMMATGGYYPVNGGYLAH